MEIYIFIFVIDYRGRYLQGPIFSAVISACLKWNTLKTGKKKPRQNKHKTLFGLAPDLGSSLYWHIFSSTVNLCTFSAINV